jgi:hypothetical protein
MTLTRKEQIFQENNPFPLYLGKHSSEHYEVECVGSESHWLRMMTNG